jgi:hypothetical protein
VVALHRPNFDSVKTLVALSTYISAGNNDRLRSSFNSVQVFPSLKHVVYIAVCLTFRTFMSSIVLLDQLYGACPFLRSDSSFVGR